MTGTNNPSPSFSLLSVVRDTVWRLRETAPGVEIQLDANNLLPDVRAQRHAVAYAIHALLSDALRCAQRGMRLRLFPLDGQLVTLVNLPGAQLHADNAALRHSHRLLRRQGADFICNSDAAGTGLRFSLPIARD